jgi:hypothetical protein
MAANISPLRMVETSPGKHSLCLDAGSTKVDEVIEELGHEPNGYFWEGVAQLLVSTEAKALEGRFDYDPEGGMFCAFGGDVSALESLGVLMASVANDPARVRAILAKAEEMGFEFDD